MTLAPNNCLLCHAHKNLFSDEGRKCFFGGEKKLAPLNGLCKPICMFGICVLSPPRPPFSAWFLICPFSIRWWILSQVNWTWKEHLPNGGESDGLGLEAWYWAERDGPLTRPLTCLSLSAKGAIITTYGKYWCTRAEFSTRLTQPTLSTLNLLCCKFLFLEGKGRLETPPKAAVHRINCFGVDMENALSQMSLVYFH